MTKEEKIVLRESMALLKSEKLLRSDPESMTDEEALSAWSVLDLIDKEVIAARKEKLRQRLFHLAESKGALTSKGHFEYQPPFSDGTIIKQKKSGKVKLDKDLLLAKLAATGFYTERIITRTVSEDKIEALVSLGEISPELIRECSSIGEPTYALVVKKPSEVLALMPKALKGRNDD
jgi:hypothetical protein